MRIIRLRIVAIWHHNQRITEYYEIVGTKQDQCLIIGFDFVHEGVTERLARQDVSKLDQAQEAYRDDLNPWFCQAKDNYGSK